ncbi:gamma-glutamyltransferase [Nonlabens ponticola]|uniref:Glutathione hydrolase proenzyme n=1 Tax=Nonlabens ponticola TaxID=2496866 RepID=A0A3S9N0F6_9FLAO|nr:gamma-glutamyltransferase [Nonlabens ponticola]AZQ44897.1 gamma-glutamyltransferase [Nonlabens ponticola]
MKYSLHLIWLLAVLISPQLHTAQNYAQHGMVVSDNEIASKVGVEIMKQGGNAIDASIATAFALAVVHPAAGNIGGGGFMVYRPKAGDVTTIDFREKAPLAATPTMFLGPDGEVIKGLNHNSALAIGVPGTVAGMALAHKKYGKLPWKKLVQPAIELARQGIPLTYALSRDARGIDQWDDAPAFLKQLFTENGKVLEFNENWKQLALANTLDIIATRGHNGFYKGEIAEQIANYVQREGGIITEKDLNQYEAIERKPIHGTFNGYDIYSMPPPSSGGVTLVAMLNLMEQADVEEIPFNSTAYTHLLIESMRRGFADRAQFLGDPDFNEDMPLDRLTSKSHAVMRFKNIDMDKASVSDPSTYGHPYDGENTTHYSVIDSDGNAVSVTYTLEQSYGSGMGSNELGFIFNNEMGDFNPQPGVTTTSGQVGSDPNIIAPGKRMLSSMTPVIVSKDNKPFLIIGSPGGRTIINTVYQTVLNATLYEMDLHDAIESMKIHHQWLPDVTYYERHKLSPDVVKNLEEMGHTMTPRNVLGRLMGISIDQQTGIRTGVSDSSSPDGAAVGY